ncbi:SDR family oxidoreductase [Cryobacterium frigoriphilum]|uniref:SDR family oxidoreductase n=1 Tax=Cryobacterium frigoriphilum TaxID=1259150 RepID=A0A4V3IQJ2_9MICO|nr:SDR family oxidoreductase [Cryobacterium frigoriphilum]TFD46908.1 SDR family oxidoreductase [Cryobacterium frigoriphilum]
MQSEEFTGLNALVTGGASGLGLAISRRLRSGGAKVAVLDINPPGDAEGLFFVSANIGDTDAVNDAVRNVELSFGGIDIVVNNAAIGAKGTVEDNGDDEWHEVFNVNVLGAVRVTRAALPLLRRSARPAVVNICSVAASVGLSERALYGATKGALSSLTLQMAADHLHEGIRFNSVEPGTADTPWVQRLLSAAEDPVLERKILESRQPHGRLVSPEEVAEAVAYLASPRALSTTGTSLTVDGGLTSLRLPATEPLTRA